MTHDQTAKVVIMAAFRALGLPRADCARGATEALHALDKAGLVVVPAPKPSTQQCPACWGDGEAHSSWCPTRRSTPYGG